MKKAIIMLLALCFASSGQSAPTVAESSPWSHSLNLTFMSLYYGTWVGGIFRDGPMLFTNVAASRTDQSGVFYFDGSYGRVLNSGDFNKNTSDELDAEVGYTYHLGSGQTQIDVGYCLSYIGATPLGHLDNDVLSSVVTLSMPNAPIAQPYVTVIRSDMMSHKVVGSGWFAYGGLVRSFKLTNAAALRFDARTGWALGNGIYGSGPGHVYYRLEAAVPCAVAKDWTVTPAVVGQTSAHGQDYKPFVTCSQVFWTLGISKTW